MQESALPPVPCFVVSEIWERLGLPGVLMESDLFRAEREILSMHHLKYRLLAAVITFVVGITVAWLTSLLPSVGMSLLTRIDPKIVFRPESVLLLCAVGVQDSKQPAFPKRIFNHDGKFVTQYEAKEDISYVFLEPVFVDREKISLRLAAGFQYVGKISVKPRHISLGFYTSYPDCKFSSRPTLRMLIDGEVMQFQYTLKSFRERKPDEEGVAFSFSEIEGERCNELLTMFISRRNYLKLINATNVEVQIDRFNFKLTETNLEALRDLASRMVK